MSLFDDPIVETQSLKRPPDPVTVAVGIERYISHHRFADLMLPVPYGDSRRLVVSRFYWDAEPPVAIDFRRELRHGKREYEAKRQYFSEHGIHYALVLDKWAGEEVEAQIRALVTLDDTELDSEEIVLPDTPVKPLLTAPRRK